MIRNMKKITVALLLLALATPLFGATPAGTLKRTDNVITPTDAGFDGVRITGISGIDGENGLSGMTFGDQYFILGAYGDVTMTTLTSGHILIESAEGITLKPDIGNVVDVPVGNFLVDNNISVGGTISVLGDPTTASGVGNRAYYDARYFQSGDVGDFLDLSARSVQAMTGQSGINFITPEYWTLNEDFTITTQNSGDIILNPAASGVVSIESGRLVTDLDANGMSLKDVERIDFANGWSIIQSVGGGLEFALTGAPPPPPPTTDFITILGATTANEQTTENYTIQVTDTEGGTEVVSLGIGWSENSPWTTIGAGGMLTIADMTVLSASVVITAVFDGATDTHTVSLVGVVDPPVAGTYPDMIVTEPTTIYPVSFVDFSPSVNSDPVASGAPEIAEWGRQANSGDTIPLTGENL